MIRGISPNNYGSRVLSRTAAICYNHRMDNKTQKNRWTKMKKIAVIEDDELLNQALVITLKKEGYQVTTGKSCRYGIALLQDNPDLMLVDINLPDGNGISICREAEHFGKTPVLFLTARDEERDMLEAFDAGCDDYVVKPFQMPVLKKRIEAILRRSGGEEDLFLFRGLRVDWKKKLLVRNRGQVLTKETILERIWDIDGQFVVENTVSVTVNRLRKKIEPDKSSPIYIKNVFGLGYTFGD